MKDSYKRGCNVPAPKCTQGGSMNEALARRTAAANFVRSMIFRIFICPVDGGKCSVTTLEP